MLSRGNVLFRVACVAIGILVIFTGPWWLLPIVGMVLSARFAAYEVPLLGILADIAWLPVYGLAIPYATLGALCLVWLFEPLRARFMPTVGV